MFKFFRSPTLFLSALIIVVSLALSACNNQKAAIFVNDTPITKDNYESVLENPVFKAGQKIYFVLLSKEPIQCPVLRLQTVKLTNKYGYIIPHMEIPYAVDIERGQNQHVVSDYFVLHQEGNYFVRIFSLDKLDKPIAQAEFMVEKR